MDYYDSRYPADYYSLGEQYIFHRDITNRNFRMPTAEEKQYCSAPSKAAAEAVEGKISGLKNFNKEIGTIVKIHDGILDVLFSDGRVFGYITGGEKKVLFDQTDLPVEQPKLQLPKDSVSWKKPDMAAAKTGVTEAGSKKAGGITEAGKKAQAGITEAGKKAQAGITEAGKKARTGITEEIEKKSAGIDNDEKDLSSTAKPDEEKSGDEQIEKETGGITEVPENKGGITEVKSSE